MVHRTFEARDPLERGSRPPDRSEPPAPAPLPGWRSIPHAIVRARGEEGYIDLVALHPQKGVALLAFLEKDEVADPAEARALFEEMLREMELARHFPGLLPVVALALEETTDELGRQLERAFAGEQAPTLPPGWVEWLVDRLAPSPRPPGEPPPRLAAPPRDDEAPPPSIGTLLMAPSRVDPSDVRHAVDAIEAPNPAPAQTPKAGGLRWVDWAMGLGFASGIVLALLIVLALFSHTGRLF
jgi:hypothetical protein